MKQKEPDVRIDKPLGPSKFSFSNIPWRSNVSTGNFPKRWKRSPKVTIDDVDFRQVRAVSPSALGKPFLLLGFTVRQGQNVKRIAIHADGRGEATFYITPAFDRDTEVKRPLNSQDRAALKYLFEILGDDDYESKLVFGDEPKYYDRFQVSEMQESRGYSVRENLAEHRDDVRNLLREIHNDLVASKAGINAMHGELLVFDRLPGTHYYGSSRTFRALERAIIRTQSI